jgi:hypothetical protein
VTDATTDRERPDGAAQRPRAVVLVGNTASPYSRALRLGRALIEEGYDVEVASAHEPGLPLEERHGDIVLRRYPASGIFGRLTAVDRSVRRTPGPARRAPLRARLLRALRSGPAEWIFWPHTVRGWWHTLSTALAPADLYHSCGTLPIAAALAARRRDRKAGRDPKVIFDVIDITTESNNVLRIPGLVLRWLARRERGWARSADGHTAVNDAFADWAVEHWDIATRPTVEPNYP